MTLCKTPLRLLVLPLLLLTMADAAVAAPRYVTDQFTVTMRRGNDPSFRVIRSLPTGTSMEVLEEGENGWDQVRLEDGTEGWVMHRFLSTDPPARERLALMERQIADRDGNYVSMRNELQTLRQQSKAMGDLEQELKHLREVSGNALAMEHENRQLQQRLQRLQETLAETVEEKKFLERNSDTEFFLSGAGVLILGMIGGAVLNRRRRRTTGLS